MNKQVKELRERVRLTPEERNKAVENGTREYNWRNSYSSDTRSLEECQWDAVAQAQLNKVLNDEDVVMIDREMELPFADYRDDTISYRQRLREAGCCLIIPKVLGGKE